MKKKRKAFSRSLFYALVFLWPLNLGYHFIIKDAYIDGLLIDYLIPTIYFQDILAVGLVLLNLDVLAATWRRFDKYLVWFVFTVGLTSLTSAFFLTSASLFARLFVYVLLMLVVKEMYSKKEDFKKVVGVVSVSVFFLSILAFLQWRYQGSVFDNYLFFGEQPYNIATPGINIENFLGEARVPSYGTFRHPNVFGGLLSIVLIWFLFEEKKSGWLKTVLMLGTMALIFTLSKFAWISFLLGAAYYFMKKAKNPWAQKTITYIVFLSVAGSLLLPYLPDFLGVRHKPSYYRRADLLHSAYRLVSTRPLFGVGYGVSTAYMDRYLPTRHDVRFAQPTHQVFVLLLTESGALSLLFFSMFFFKKLRKATNTPVFFISLAQIIFLGSFDHYFMTMHQAQLLWWIILGFV